VLRAEAKLFRFSEDFSTPCYRSPDGKASSISRAIERIGAVVTPMLGMNQRISPLILETAADCCGGKRLISSSGSTTRLGWSVSPPGKIKPCPTATSPSSSPHPTVAEYYMFLDKQAKILTPLLNFGSQAASLFSLKVELDVQYSSATFQIRRFFSADLLRRGQCAKSSFYFSSQCSLQPWLATNRPTKPLHLRLRLLPPRNQAPQPLPRKRVPPKARLPPLLAPEAAARYSFVPMRRPLAGA
jgi:hypothetical protein